MNLRIGKPEITAGVRKGLLIAAATIAIGLIVGPRGERLPAVDWLQPPQPIAMLDPAPRAADLRGTPASVDVKQMADWIAGSGDAAGLEFLIIDKRNAQLYVFGADARLRAASPILLGSAVGDDTVPGIGEKAIDDVLPEERTTPAGRFVGQRGTNLRKEDVVWVDYDAAVSMHRVLTTNPHERRLERLASDTSDDNRISYGCINIPVDFFEQHVGPTFNGRTAIIYVLPEVKPLEQVFASFRTPGRPSLMKVSQVRQSSHGG